jgi:hypothetical protein
LSYDSSGASSWAGLGWDISVGDISVDTEWGVPLFCPRDNGPACGNVESESYLLDGEALMPSAVRTDYQDRVAEREDFTRRVETEYERIIRHGSTPENYFWEVRDKSGNVRWYGGYPDGGGPTGDPGTRDSGRFQNDGTRNASAILTDDHENGFRWYLSAMRDVGVNMFRYEYDTVTYQNVRSGDGTAWQALGAGADCPNGRTCAKHVYLRSILYTGASEASGHDEDPPYEVRFVRSDSRPDPVLDARGGFLDLDQERLDSIEVRYVETDELITKYDLEYDRDRFGKSKLVSVTQTGCAHVDPCDATTAATHTFAYYDDVETAGGGFASTPATWDTGLDNLANNIYDRASALGMSQSNGGDGHVYLGFNGAAPSKTGSFGGSITVSGGQTDSLVEFLDINGDSLPDKVFEDDGVVKYRLNAARPEDEPDDAVSFVTKDDVAGRFDSLPVEREFGITGGIEAYMGVVGVLNVGGEWSFADGYFTDANADGLPDYVVGGTVYFNSLVCTGGGGLSDPALCKPTFQTNDNQSRVPLDVDPVDDEDESATDTLQMLRELAPPVDTVRRWVAPYAGWVEVSGVATLEAPPYDSAAGSEPVWVSLQRNEDFISSADLVGVGAQWDPARTLFVGKGAPAAGRGGVARAALGRAGGRWGRRRAGT